MGGHLLMSRKECLRKVILEGVKEGRLTIREASARLSISYRQGKRIVKRYRREGDAGLLHKNRSRPHLAGEEPASTLSYVPLRR